MRIFIYSRKSVYTGKGESIENQVEMCRQYIAGRIDGGKDAEITVYEDEGFSGKSLDRPQFQKMLADSKQQKPDYIVCYRLDRISRSVGDFAMLIDELNSRKISFICIKEQFDTSTPMGRAMMYIASVFAQLERETIAERVRDNMFMLARSGRWLGGTPPTGFLSEKVEEVVVDGKVKTSCKLKADPSEIGTVKTIYQKYLELESLSGVSKHLIREGIRGRNGKPYTLPGIKDILRNPVYCVADRDVRGYFASLGSDIGFLPEQCSDRYGLLAYNRRDNSHRGKPRNDPSQWVVAIGKHRGIVSGLDWIRIQELLAEKKLGNPEKPPQSYNDYSLLSGQIFCSKCGARMFAKRRSNSETLFDYICGCKLQAGQLCDSQNLSGQQADDLVCDYLMDYAREDSGIYQMLEELKKRLAAQLPADPAGRFDALLRKKHQEMDGLVATLSVAGGKEAVVRHVSGRMEQLDGELQELKLQKARAEDQKSAKEMGEAQLELLAGAFASFKQNFPNLTIQEKREFIRIFVEKMKWDGKDLHIFLYGG